jgi:hypothetical protein
MKFSDRLIWTCFGAMTVIVAYRLGGGENTLRGALIATSLWIIMIGAAAAVTLVERRRKKDS